MSRARGVLLVVISALSFSLMPLFKSWAAKGGAGTDALLALRFGIASAALWAIVLAGGAKIPRGAPLLVLVLMGAGCYFGEAYCYFGAIDAGVPSGLVSLILYTFPALVALASWLLFAEQLSPGKLIALALALAGMVAVGWSQAVPSGGPGRLAETPVTGLLLAGASALIYAVYILVGSRLPKAVEAVPAAAIVTGSAAVSFTVLALIRGSHPPSTAAGWGGVLALAFVSTVVGITALLAGIARIGPVQASTLSIIEPAGTFALGVLLLHEPAGPLQIAGGVLILLGAAIAARAK